VVSETIELTKSAFADVVGFMLDPCSSLLPGERPIPGTIPPDPEGCKHWIELLMVVQVADVAIDRALSRQQLGEAMGDARSGGVDAANKAMLRQVVDDFCGTPPRWQSRGRRRSGRSIPRGYPRSSCLPSAPASRRPPITSLTMR
jgi:hypothetical protein